MANEKRFFSHLRHAVKMVLRNRRAYAKMSVTVVLCFSILLGYMALTDADLYNRYAKVFSLPREVVQCYTYDDALAETFLSQVQKNLPDAKIYRYFGVDTTLTSFQIEIHAQCFFLPEGVEAVYTTDGSSTVDRSSEFQSSCAEPLSLLGEKQTFDLQKNEAIVNESFYRSLQNGGAEEEPVIPITFYWADGSYSIWEVTIVGICEDTTDNAFLPVADGSAGYVTIYLSQAQLGEEVGEFGLTKHIIFTASDSPEEVQSMGRALGLVSQGIVEAQNEARRELRSSIRSKAVTACVMFVLLAICLYSSLSNVLETRNFEIGVKRAIGASAWSIIRQFLYEGLLVLGFDCILSAAIVADFLLVYKIIQKVFSGVVWIAHVSNYSLAIYCVCALSLTVTYSLIFAYRSTRVEIVRYLKAES